MCSQKIVEVEVEVEVEIEVEVEEVIKQEKNSIS